MAVRRTTRHEIEISGTSGDTSNMPRIFGTFLLDVQRILLNSTIIFFKNSAAEVVRTKISVEKKRKRGKTQCDSRGARNSITLR